MGTAADACRILLPEKIMKPRKNIKRIIPARKCNDFFFGQLAIG
jgi:hypothetical protein